MSWVEIIGLFFVMAALVMIVLFWFWVALRLVGNVAEKSCETCRFENDDMERCRRCAMTGERRICWEPKAEPIEFISLSPLISDF